MNKKTDSHSLNIQKVYDYANIELGSSQFVIIIIMLVAVPPFND